VVTGLLSMMLARDTGTAAEAEAVIAIAAGAKSAKITLRIGHSYSLNVTFLSSAQTSLRVETWKNKLNGKHCSHYFSRILPLFPGIRKSLDFRFPQVRDKRHAITGA
jgi:hypothetical protein